MSTRNKTSVKEYQKITDFKDLEIEIEKICRLKTTSNHIYQPLRSGRIWLKVNFFSGV